MLLIVTNRRDEHVDLVIPRLNDDGIKFFRLNTDDYPTQVHSTFEINNDSFDWNINTPFRELSLKDVTSIWYRRPFPSHPHTDLANSPEYTVYVQNQSEAYLHGLW